MKKLDLIFAAWLWAVSHHKEKEYYADNYGPEVEFTKEIGGTIVSHFFLAEPRLLAIAYGHLSFEWDLIVWCLYPEKLSQYDTRANINFEEMSWLMFRALSHNIELSVLDNLVEGDYRRLWDELAKKYPDKVKTVSAE